MFEIVRKQILSEGVKRIDVVAPNISSKAQPGQFVSLCVEEGDERIPLSIIDANPKKKTISLIFQEVGETTGKLGTLPINESIYSILGPLGMPSKIEKKGVVVCIATGMGVAHMLSVVRALKDCGNKVIGILGAVTNRALLMEPQMRIACDEVMIATNDGSFARRGLATDIFHDLLKKQKIDMVYAAGSVKMMQEVCATTKKKKIPTRVQLHPVMVDCVGMSGSCRLKVGGNIIMASIDGPEFDGHKIDFDDFIIRKNAFEERDQWQGNLKSPYSRQRNGSGILTKFLSVFRKK